VEPPNTVLEAARGLVERTTVARSSSSRQLSSVLTGIAPQIPATRSRMTWQAMATLFPYLGTRTTEHFSRARRTYGDDRSGAVTYRFNSLGFRCEEYNDQAKKKIFVCGASDTFGTGLNVEDTWPVRFAERFAKHHGLSASDVCLMNFSEGGCSNRCITRTLSLQTRRATPDLLLAHFTYSTRGEFLVPTTAVGSRNAPVPELGSFCSWGRWMDVPSITREPQTRLLTMHEKRWARDVSRRVRRYYRHYDALAATYDTLQQMLLLQFLTASLRIPLLYCVNGMTDITREDVISNHVILSMYEMLDMRQFLPFSMSDETFWVDVAAEPNHQGPLSNEKFAEALWAEYLARCLPHLSTAHDTEPIPGCTAVSGSSSQNEPAPPNSRNAVHSALP
jgi:hypothetical protein